MKKGTIILYGSFFIFSIFITINSKHFFLDLFFANALFAFVCFGVSILYFENYLTYLSYPFVMLPRLFTLKDKKITPPRQFMNEAKEKRKDSQKRTFLHFKIFILYTVMECILLLLNAN